MGACDPVDGKFGCSCVEVLRKLHIQPTFAYQAAMGISWTRIVTEGLKLLVCLHDMFDLYSPGGDKIAQMVHVLFLGEDNWSVEYGVDIRP